MVIKRTLYIFINSTELNIIKDLATKTMVEQADRTLTSACASSYKLVYAQITLHAANCDACGAITIYHNLI